MSNLAPWVQIGSAVAARTKNLGGHLLLEEGRLYRMRLVMELEVWWKWLIEAFQFNWVGPQPMWLLETFVFEPDTICQRWTMDIINQQRGVQDVRCWHELDATSGRRQFFLEYTARAPETTYAARPGDALVDYNPMRMLSVELVPE